MNQILCVPQDLSSSNCKSYTRERVVTMEHTLNLSLKALNRLEMLETKENGIHRGDGLLGL